LKLYHNIDIALDPLPYNGHSTACDGLWMGVPLLTLPGATSVGRAGASFLTNLEMNEWIATSPEDLIDRAKGFAADLNRTAEIRRTLRARMRQSIICDGANYTRDLEQQLRWMWRRWCGSSSNG
jgi:predicted O-linked N-acetylglucosamine transferase (SPINDLY family)